MKPLIEIKEPVNCEGRFVCLYPTNQKRIDDLKSQLIINPTTEKEFSSNCQVAEKIRIWKKISQPIY